MKKIFYLFTFSTILLIISPVSLHAIIFLSRSAPYIAASGSWDWYIHNNLNVLVDSTDSDSQSHKNIRPKSGANASLSIGYCLDQWRLEAEGIYHSKKATSTLTNSGYTLTDPGLVSRWSVMANVYYDIPLILNYGFYLGAGLGAGFRKTELRGRIHRSKNDGAFAFQVMGGTFFDICSNLTLTLAYRLFGITRPEDVVFENGSSTITVHAHKGTPLVQSIELGLRLGF